jgi:hypothetical protein
MKRLDHVFGTTHRLLARETGEEAERIVGVAHLLIFDLAGRYSLKLASEVVEEQHQLQRVGG